MKFCFITWIHSLLFNAPLGVLLSLLKGEESLTGLMGTWVLVLIFSVPFSFPGLLILSIGYNLSRSGPPSANPFLFVMVFALLGLAGCFGLVFLLFGDSLFRELGPIWLTAFVSVVVALLINRKRYYRLAWPLGLDGQQN